MWYYNLAGTRLTELPKFDALRPASRDVVADINFPLTYDPIATSGLADFVGAVFEGFVTVPEDGIYTMSTASNDGSRLLVGGQQIVNNDGIHATREESGIVGLMAGAHRVRVEFFDREYAGELIVSMKSDSMPLAPIPADAWSHSAACPVDMNGDGSIDAFDVQLFLDAVASDDPSADFNADVAINYFDVAEFLKQYTQGCP